MAERGVLVLGGGLSGMAAAWALAKSGWRNVTIVERGTELGGLAGTFRQAGHFYPLTYHHILPLDQPLHFFLHTIGALESVRWRPVTMLFRKNGELYDLGRPADFLRFPMSPWSKLRFVMLMVRCFRKTEWMDWCDHNAEELLEAWGNTGVREALFEPLTRLKFDLPCNEVSAAWLGARLHGREGSKPFGYIPGTNWTKVLCDGIGELLDHEGVTVRLGTRATRLRTERSRVTGLETSDGEFLPADVLISTVPTEVYLQLIGRDETPLLNTIGYSAIHSMICAANLDGLPDFYWMNLADLDCRACGLFRLDALNPDIGAPGEVCLNFVTHFRSRDDPRFTCSDEQLRKGYFDDFRRIFGADLEPNWFRLSRVPMYSPVLTPGYRNPPVRSQTWSNLYFAGNYRTFPSVVSTGTALASGLEGAQSLLQDHGQNTPLLEAAAKFRLPEMRRAGA